MGGRIKVLILFSSVLLRSPASHTARKQPSGEAQWNVSLCPPASPTARKKQHRRQVLCWISTKLLAIGQNESTNLCLQKILLKTRVFLDQVGVKLHYSSKQTVRKWGSNACKTISCFRSFSDRNNSIFPDSIQQCEFLFSFQP